MTNLNPPLETTDRYLVLLPATDLDRGIQDLTDATGMTAIARAADFPDHSFAAADLEGDAVAVFDSLGVAVMALDPDQVQALRVAEASDQAILAIESERVVYALQSPPLGFSADYLRGYRDAVNHLTEGMLAPTEPPLAPAAFSEVANTWGLQATEVVNSPYSGLGVKVAVLDTGMDLTHPDFEGRTLESQSFIAGESAQDRNGHGTHCIGTACGPRDPAILPRYGVAYNSDIFVGKVLSDRGSGSDGGILAGIEWALNQGCQVISMSLGSPTRPGDTFSRVYAAVGRRTLRQGSLIVAAAGNESNRAVGRINPVAYPANAPTIMAVGALDANLQVANFSNRSINLNGGQVDIAAPGGNGRNAPTPEIYSTWFMPIRYNRISGTSMATPHVAGIAALYIEATGQTGPALWSLLMQAAQRLLLPSVDVGAGLVQAPRL